MREAGIQPRLAPVGQACPESFHLENLRRLLAIYRMVFGQLRQDDLMAYLVERVDPEVINAQRELIRINLSPQAIDAPMKPGALGPPQ